MKMISLLEFRQQTKSVLANVQKGQRVILTYRGKPIARLEPFRETSAAADDPFYSLHGLAVDDGENLTNSEIDRVIYGQ